LRTFTSRCGPSPAGANPSSSSTTKSSGVSRVLATPRGAPNARGGASARARQLSGIDEQHHRLGRDAFLASEESESLGGGGLDVHAIHGHAEQLRESFPHPLAK